MFPHNIPNYGLITFDHQVDGVGALGDAGGDLDLMLVVGFEDNLGVGGSHVLWVCASVRR